jgi:uncharacterized RmlC-like cupin family protein
MIRQSLFSKPNFVDKFQCQGDPQMTTSKHFVIRKGEESKETAQSGGLALLTGVGAVNTPASKLWVGRGSNGPGGRSKPHHHAEAETACFVLSGKMRMYYGDGFKDHVDMSAGDYFFVPAFLPHVEANMSVTEDLVCLVCRSPGDIVVNLPDVDDGVLEGYRRA